VLVRRRPVLARALRQPITVIKAHFGPSQMRITSHPCFQRVEQ
jgi:hypothetical protein